MECRCFIYIGILKDDCVYQHEAEQIPSDTGEEVSGFKIRLLTSDIAIPIYQGGTSGKIELKMK